MTITEQQLRDRICSRFAEAYKNVPVGFFRLAPCGAEDFESRAKRHELYVTLVNELGYDEDEAETIAFG